MNEETRVIWGRSRSEKAKYVHLFINDEDCCGLGSRLDLQNDDWDPNNPETCPHCRKYFAWLKRGFHRVPESSGMRKNSLAK